MEKKGKRRAVPFSYLRLVTYLRPFLSTQLASHFQWPAHWSGTKPACQLLPPPPLLASTSESASNYYCCCCFKHQKQKQQQYTNLAANLIIILSFSHSVIQLIKSAASGEMNKRRKEMIRQPGREENEWMCRERGIEKKDKRRKDAQKGKAGGGREVKERGNEKSKTLWEG